MGTHFFAKNPGIKTPSMNMESRAMGASAYAAPRFGGAAAKDIGAAAGLNNAMGAKKTTGSSAYAPGPKKV